MGLQNIFSNYTYVFILIMVRYIGMFLTAPILGSRVIPRRVRIAFVFFLALITLPVLMDSQTVEIPDYPLLIVLTVIRELAVGLSIGFISFLVFAAIQLAGQFIDLRMGFAMAKVVDPINGSSEAPIIGQFKNTLAILLFLAINGHHVLIRAIYHSYNIIPLGEAVFTAASLKYIFSVSAEIFQLAIMIALPVMGTLFVVDIIFGFLARSMPQMNIFIVGLPMKIIIGFIVLILSIHYSMYYIEDLFYNMYKQLFELIKLLG